MQYILQAVFQDFLLGLGKGAIDIEEDLLLAGGGHLQVGFVIISMLFAICGEVDE